MSTPADVDEIVQRICPLLSGHGQDIQGAVLADLVAMWLAGHFCIDGRAETDALREELLRIHIDTVRSLVAVNEKIILQRHFGEAHE